MNPQFKHIPSVVTQFVSLAENHALDNYGEPPRLCNGWAELGSNYNLMPAVVCYDSPPYESLIWTFPATNKQTGVFLSGRKGLPAPTISIVPLANTGVGDLEFSSVVYSNLTGNFIYRSTSSNLEGMRIYIRESDDSYAIPDARRSIKATVQGFIESYVSQTDTFSIRKLGEGFKFGTHYSLKKNIDLAGQGIAGRRKDSNGNPIPLSKMSLKLQLQVMFEDENPEGFEKDQESHNRSE